MEQDDAFHLTAVDVRRYEFQTVMRGYDRERVDQFKNQVADEMERLMRAYFTEGRHVGRIDDLVTLATEAGLDATATRDALESGRFTPDVRADQAQAQAYGINGVPFFVIDGKYGVSGAQPAEAFTQVVRQVWEERGAADSVNEMA